MLFIPRIISCSGRFSRISNLKTPAVFTLSGHNIKIKALSYSMCGSNPINKKSKPYSAPPAVFTLSRHNIKIKALPYSTCDHSSIKIKTKPYCPSPKEGHDERNMRLRRPLSPHLQIYATQLTSSLSAFHRITGFTAGGYIILFGMAALVMPKPLPCYVEYLEDFELGIIPITMAKFIVAWPYVYHYCNGMRHLIWDTGNFLTIKSVYITGYIMITCTVLITTLLSLHYVDDDCDCNED